MTEKYELLWTVNAKHRMEFDLDDANDLRWLAELLKWPDGDWFGGSDEEWEAVAAAGPTKEQVLSLAGDEFDASSYTLRDNLMSMASGRTWFDADPSEVEVQWGTVR